MLTAASRTVLVVLVLVILMADRSVLAQTVRLSTSEGNLRVQVPMLGLIEGAVLEWLRDGRAVTVEMELGVLAQARGAAIAAVRQTFTLSFDLWEERFAVLRSGTPARSISHLAARDAEAWCLDQLAVPQSGLGGLGRDEPIWIRLEFQVQNPASEPVATGDGFSLERLIDALSRRRPATGPRRVIEAGPLRVVR